MAGFVVTIDGPAGSGKSSVAKLVADKIGATFLDTGSMYRMVTVVAIDAGCDMTDAEAILLLMDSTKFEFKSTAVGMSVSIDGVDVSEKIRLPEITNQVHYIASNEKLRSRLVQMQRDFAKAHEKVVTEGRDQGTVAFVDAEYKFFVTADVAERARRRAAELESKGISVDLEKLTADIVARDHSDSTRKVGPLTPAADAIIIDTTNLTLDEVVSEIVKKLKV